MDKPAPGCRKRAGRDFERLRRASRMMIGRQTGHFGGGLVPRSSDDIQRGNVGRWTSIPPWTWIQNVR